MPDEGLVPPEVVARILRGGADKVREAGCALVGGHTVRNAEPLYGLSVTGLVHPKRLLTNAAARPGDLLLLTKPLGTGIITTAIKRGIASAGLERKTISLMSRLNRAGADLAERGLVHAATDVTGFGLLGHLASMCRASGVSVELRAGGVPVIAEEVHALIKRGCVPGGSKQNLNTAREIMHAAADVSPAVLALLADAQTSGGLLLCVAPRRRESVLAVLKAHRTACAAVIGQVVPSQKTADKNIRLTPRDVDETPRGT